MQQANRNRLCKWAFSGVVWGCLFLLAGIAVYLLFRSKSITLYRWCADLGLAPWIDGLRDGVAGWRVSDFVRFSLPDGLYCASYILLMDALWRGDDRGRYVAVAFIPVVALVHEAFQGLGLARGTFDVADVCCYALPLLVYFACKQFSYYQPFKFKTT